MELEQTILEETRRFYGGSNRSVNLRTFGVVDGEIQESGW